MTAQDQEEILTKHMEGLVLDEEQNLMRRMRDNTLRLCYGKEELDSVLSALTEMCEHENPLRSIHKGPKKLVFVTLTAHDDVVRLLHEGKVVLYNGTEIMIFKATEEDFDTVQVVGAPYWILDEYICQRLSAYGEVFGIQHVNKIFPVFPYCSFRTGNRRVTMKMRKLVPNVLCFEGNLTWLNYPGVIPVCHRCKTEDHPSYRCSYTECLNCFERGHIARNCARNCIRCKNSSHRPAHCPNGFKIRNDLEGSAEVSNMEIERLDHLYAASNH